jgi:hypothetical protein
MALVRVSCIQNTQIRRETTAKVFGKVDTFWTYQDSLAKIGQERSKREEMAAGRLNALSTSFGSKSFLPLRFHFSLLQEFGTDHYIM